MNEAQILELVEGDETMMRVLNLARELNLPDWIIGAGFIRNKVWDYLHGRTGPTVINDIDLIYFDPSNINPDQEEEWSKEMGMKTPPLKWEIKNHARMHLKNGDPPYASSQEGLSRWLETATAVGIRFGPNGQLELVTPYGIEDLVKLIVRPTPRALKNLGEYQDRQKQKNWQGNWPKLTILNLD